MKSERHAMILNLIETTNVETQEELADMLKQRGICVTQATVSRDIKELRLIKVLAENGGYKYATVDKAEAGMKERFVRIFGDSVVGINTSANLVIVKTLSGSANAAAEAVDSMHWNDIVGTMAGDNTIFIAARDEKAVPDIVKRLSAMIKK
ncbi:MAG: arginine repressor [Eubacteriales bacterium]|jgi:transcriptional regulator of arginine metabolism|nr:arginine repressor [Eubacteriales bacterium]MCI6979579.1 arginine repressor [Clostridiales bacterium]MDD6721283.1 arginine repressor [Clostridiales bacterium]MDY5693637.1 arginine repressor [Eubacteriales bacterium]HZK46042.1 arginine repressor [Clostridia bacterium]